MSDMKTWSTNGVLHIKTIIIEKLSRKSAPEASWRALFDFSK